MGDKVMIVDNDVKLLTSVERIFRQVPVKYFFVFFACPCTERSPRD